MGVAKYNEYLQMASYAADSVRMVPAISSLSRGSGTEVNVDPSTDKGTSFMDSGSVYFKAGVVEGLPKIRAPF